MAHHHFVPKNKSLVSVHNRATGNSRFENANSHPPPPKKKIPFGKMLDFARSNTISTQTSNIYLNQLQRYGQFAEVYMLLEILSLEIYLKVSVINSFPSVPHIETDRQRSITVPFYQQSPLSVRRRHPDTASP